MTGVDAERVEVLRQARARWRAAEDRLFPGALADPDSYRRALSVVAQLLEELRAGTNSVKELLGLDADPAPLLQVCALHGVDRLMLDAAFAVRERELAVIAERNRRTAAIAAARHTGATWADLEGSWEQVRRTGARHTEMHLASGRALVASIDPYSGGGPHRLEVVVLDASTGTPVESTDQDRSFADRDGWLAARERWRAEIERGSRR